MMRLDRNFSLRTMGPSRRDTHMGGWWASPYLCYSFLGSNFDGGNWSEMVWYRLKPSCCTTSLWLEFSYVRVFSEGDNFSESKGDGEARKTWRRYIYFFEVPPEAFHNIISFYQSMLRHKFLPLPENPLIWVTDRETITNLGRTTNERISLEWTQDSGMSTKNSDSVVCNMKLVWRGWGNCVRWDSRNWKEASHTLW